jgi:hypothetical protein
LLDILPNNVHLEAPEYLCNNCLHITKISGKGNNKSKNKK